MNKRQVWQKVMDCKSKDNRHRGVANNLINDEITTIIATMDWFGADYRLATFDLKIARYRVFDWLATAIDGRMPESAALKVLAYAFLSANGDVNQFIENLRVNDYEIDREWQNVWSD